ncbi:MAG: response regulator [Phycisphaerales bacterium]|nr:MAG: response regulator [Phycisphaerales bacterium]
MTQSSLKQLRVLVLGTPDGGEDFTGWVVERARVQHVATVEEALEALRTEPFDVIISRAADFIPFQGLHFSRQAAAIIDSVSQGVCIVGKTGELDWANPKMLSFSTDVRQRVCRCCMETLTWVEVEAGQVAADSRGRRFSFTSGGGERFEVTATPVIDLQHRVTHVAAVVWDATNAGRLQDKIDAIDQAGRELLSLDAAQFSRLDAQERLTLLGQKILRCTRELLHFDNFEIRVLDKHFNKLDLILCSGMPADAALVELYAAGEGNGICGYVASRGRSYICPDTTKDPRYLPGIENAQSSLTVPLWLHDKVVGIANFESTRLAAFTEDDRQFAEIFGRYIALALHLLELLASERQTTTGQLGTNVMAEITAPLNDILTDVENLVEDYIGHDDLRRRLRTVSENVVRIRETFKDLTSAEIGIVGVRPTRKHRKDPVLDGKRILVAEDEDVLRETIRDVLGGYGCRVCTANDGAAATELISQQSFDLVLSDIKMPERNGYEVFAAAKAANPKTPVILTTGFGYDPNHSIVRASRVGLAAVLFKPFKVDQLLNEIRGALKSVPA